MKNEEEGTNVLNNFFVNIVSNLSITAQREFLNTVDISQDPIENAICKYENHLRSICIKKSSMLSENT